MILPTRYIWPSLIWILLWLLLMGNTPMEASEAVSVQPRPVDLGILKEAALIGGICSIITAIIWATGLTTAARYKHLGRK